jgi:ABC-type spermidine/putrescine transport system permease subunit II
VSARRRRAGRLGTGSWIVVGAALLFLYAPLLLSVAYSFNPGVDGRQTARFTGFGVGAYAAAWADDSLRASIVSGFQVAVCVMAIATVLGSALGYALVRHPSAWVRRTLSGLVALLLIVPEVVIAVSFLQLTSVVQVSLGFGTFVVALTPLAIALVAFVVRAGAVTLRRDIEEAARDLGATEVQVATTVVVPQLAPAIAIGAILSFTLAFDNLVVATFLSTPDVSTLAVYLYSSLNYGTTPKVYAATTAVFGFTLLLFAAAGIVFAWSRRRRRGAGRGEERAA